MTFKFPSDVFPDHPAYNIEAHLKLVQDLWEKYPLNNEEACDAHLVNLLKEICRPRPPWMIIVAVRNCIKEIFEEDDIYRLTQPALSYTPYLTKMQARFSGDTFIRAAEKAVKEFFSRFFSALPDSAYEEARDLTDEVSLPVYTLCQHHEQLVTLVHAHFIHNKIDELSVLPSLTRKLFANVCTASGTSADTYDGKRKLIYPYDSALNAEERINTYLKDTPFIDLFGDHVPFSIPAALRFEHSWILSGTGHGKTTFISGQLLKDIEEINKGNATAIVIDSQNALIPQLLRVDCPKILIDPTDFDHPIALNLFDARLETARSAAERFSFLENAIKMFQFVIGSLFEQPMTPRQATLFAYIAELLLTKVPNATIKDFRNLLDPTRSKAYQEKWLSASSEVRDYFETEFLSNTLNKETAQQVLSRLRALLRNPAFLNMFSSPMSKLDLGKEMNEGKLILINTYKDFLTPDGTKLFGRFWIAQIAQAAVRRQTLTKKLPTYVYIDEAQDYLKGGDENIEAILDQARKQSIGLTIIHHRTDQLKSPEGTLVNALDSNTTTKVVGTLNDADLGRLPRMMNTSEAHIKSLIPKQTFAIYVRGVTPSAITIEFPNAQIPRQLSDSAFEQFLKENRAKYCYTPSPPAAEDSLPEEPEPSVPEPIEEPISKSPGLTGWRRPK